MYLQHNVLLDDSKGSAEGGFPSTFIDLVEIRLSAAL